MLIEIQSMKEEKPRKQSELELYMQVLRYTRQIEVTTQELVDYQKDEEKIEIKKHGAKYLTWNKKKMGHQQYEQLRYAVEQRYKTKIQTKKTENSSLQDRASHLREELQKEINQYNELVGDSIAESSHNSVPS